MSMRVCVCLCVLVCACVCVCLRVLMLTADQPLEGDAQVLGIVTL
jgi:hypothetical protein